LTYGTIGADFRFAIFGALAILVVFIPLTLNAYKRKA
jgi:ABC-2 type transport system permease protein